MSPLDEPPAIRPEVDRSASIPPAIISLGEGRDDAKRGDLANRDCSVDVAVVLPAELPDLTLAPAEFR